MPRGAWALAAVGLAGAAATLLLARLLDYPSEADSLQDLLTGHFARPDRTRPWPEFWQLQGNFWVEWAAQAGLAAAVRGGAGRRGVARCGAGVRSASSWSRRRSPGS
ncbi:hypothetical protein STENM223S_07491 [Streptomyces tendae]